MVNPLNAEFEFSSFPPVPFFKIDEAKLVCLLSLWTLIWVHLRGRRKRHLRLLVASILATTSTHDRAGRLYGIPRQRTHDWFHENCINMQEIEFKTHFRMKKSVFYRLVGLLRVPHWYNSLSPEKVVAICLYRLATLATIREIANQFSVSESTVVKCTRVVEIGECHTK